MQSGIPSPEYEARLRTILGQFDWKALREFVREQNEVPDAVYGKGQHFWEVLLHKLICNRIDMLGSHDRAREWLTEQGYSTDLGGY